MRRLPPWLSRGRAAILGTIVVAGLVGIRVWEVHIQEAVVHAAVGQLAASVGVRATLIRGWADARRSDAALVATVLGSNPSHWRDEHGQGSTVLDAMVAQGHYAAAWVADTVADSASTRVSTVNGSVVVDFFAPVMSAGVRTGTVVLRAHTGLKEFQYLAVLAPPMSNPTEHATLFAVSGDSALILAHGTHDSTTHSGRVALPPWTRKVLASGQDNGTGAGLFGPGAIYAAAVVPGMQWIVARQIDQAEIDSALRPSLWVNRAVFLLIILLVVFAIAALWRTTWLRRANEVAQLRSDFVASVSHELRTPLTQIRMYAEMLRNGLLPEPADTERALRVIHKESERLALLVDKTLNFARPGSTAEHAAAPRVDVAEEIRYVISSFAPLAAERDARIVAEDLPPVSARIERDALHQVLLNLLENAAKYGPRGQTICIGAREAGDTTVIWVEDEGPGVPAGERDRIWNAFHRGSAADASSTTGSGIGLAVVRELTTRFGGTANVEPSRGTRGARFVVTLRGG